MLPSIPTRTYNRAMRNFDLLNPASALALCVIICTVANASPDRSFSMAQVLHYPYSLELVSAERQDIIAWVRNFEGVRNIWVARGPAFTASQVTQYTEDDGQELTQLSFTADGTHVVFVRGGDHDANWPAAGNLAPDPSSAAEQPQTTIWSVPVTGGPSVKIAEGDTPAVSSKGQLAYTKDDQVWTVSLDGQGKAERLFFDRGKDSDLRWSPDGSRLAFVSNRTDHGFIGIYTSKDKPLVYLSPSTGNDDSPRWSPNGSQLAFVRRPGNGGPPEPILKQIPHVWSIWVANAGDGSGHALWSSPNTLSGSFPEVEKARICTGAQATAWFSWPISTIGHICTPLPRRAARRCC